MTEKIRSRYKTYSREEVKDAFNGGDTRVHYATKMMLQERLDAIWRLGDRDEVSIKHVIYSIGAILAGRKWNEQVAYGDEVGMNQKAKVKRSWAIVETMLDHWGLDTFAKVFYSTKYGQTGYSDGEKDPLDAYWSYDWNPKTEDGYKPPSKDDDTPAARAYHSEEVKLRKEKKFEEMKARIKRNPPKPGPRGDE